jgi:hypothetical protein
MSRSTVKQPPSKRHRSPPRSRAIIMSASRTNGAMFGMPERASSSRYASHSSTAAHRPGEARGARLRARRLGRRARRLRIRRRLRPRHVGLPVLTHTTVAASMDTASQNNGTGPQDAPRSGCHQRRGRSRAICHMPGRSCTPASLACQPGRNRQHSESRDCRREPARATAASPAPQAAPRRSTAPAGSPAR